MADTHIIEVRLPDNARPAAQDIELLRSLFEAVAAFKFGAGAEPSSAEAALTLDGWAVQARLTWVAEARRGAEFEQVTGASKLEALEHLQRLVRADRVLSAL